MLDELQLLREVFADDVEPDAGAWALVRERVAAASDAGPVSSDRDDRPPHAFRRASAAAIAIAACVAVALVVTGLRNTDNPQPSPAYLASPATVAPLRATGTVIQHAGAVTCTEAHVCYIATTEGGGGTQNPVGALYRSDDGGVHWTLLHLPQLAVALTAVSCPTETHCFVGAGMRRNAQDLGTPEPGVLLATNDSGRTWSTQPLPSQLLRDPLGASERAVQPELFNNEQIVCVTPTTCMLTMSAGFSWRSGGGTFMKNVFLRTVDGGRHWTKTLLASQPPLVPGYQPGITMELDPAVIGCPTTESCVVVASAGDKSHSLVWRTDDGGDMWTMHKVPVRDIVHGRMFCADVGHCWVAAGNSLAVTDDGGATWRTLPQPSVDGGAESVDAISCPTADDCWVAGAGAGVAVSHDHGRSWAAVPVPTGLKGAYAIDCNAGGSCVAFGVPRSVSTVGDDTVVLSNNPSKS